MAGDVAGRRKYDSVPADIALAIEDGLRETRHVLRQDITVLAAQVQTGNLQSATEHAQVHAELLGLREDVSELKPLHARVAALESTDNANVAVSKALVRLRTTMLAVAGLLVAAVPVAIALLK